VKKLPADLHFTAFDSLKLYTFAAASSVLY
jgi:hypothetical protein